MVNRRISVTLIILFGFILSLSGSLKAQESTLVNYVGSLQILAVDEIDKTTGTLKCRLTYYLKTGDGTLYRIEDSEGILGKIKPSEKINLSGTMVDNKIVVNTVERLPIISPTSALDHKMAVTEDTKETIDEQKTLVALFNYPDKLDQPFTIQDVKNWVLNNTDSVDNFIKENSYDKTWLTVDFIDFKTLPNESTYYANDDRYNLFLNDSINLLDSTIDFQNYARLIFFYADNDPDGVYGSGSVGKWSMSSSGDGDFTASIA